MPPDPGADLRVAEAGFSLAPFQAFLHAVLGLGRSGELRGGRVRGSVRQVIIVLELSLRETLARHEPQFFGAPSRPGFDCDDEGENGAKQALLELAPHSRVRLGWSSATHPQFRGRQPEAMTAEGWDTLCAAW